MQHDRYTLNPALFEKVCRTCLCEGDLTNIFDVVQAADVLSGLLSIKVSRDDTFPQNICNSCLQEISAVQDFVKRCRDVEETLKLVSFEFADEMDLKEEIKDLDYLVDDETNSEYSCSFCNAAFESEVELQLHKKEVNHGKALDRKCKVCKKKFQNPSLLKKHMRSHTKEKPFECDICFTRFSDSSNLRRHKKRHSGERPYVCEICGSAFTRASVLNDHKIKIHSGERSYACSYCDKSFREENTYQLHMSQHKVEKGEFLPEKQRKHLESHTCTICDRVLSTKGCLKMHMQIHGDKMFLCSHCGKGFANKVGLDSHSFVHSSEKLFQCQFCEKNFGRRMSLVQHEMIHTGKKPYSCQSCPKAFVQHHQLQDHIRTHTGERPFRCPYCNESFAVNGYLKVHIRTHTGEKPYVCSVCSKGFYNASSMKKHLKVHDHDKSTLSDDENETKPVLLCKLEKLENVEDDLHQ